MIQRLENSITEEDFRRGTTLESIDFVGDEGELSMFLPNMKNVLNFKTFNGETVSFYISAEELNALATTDFYEITKDMALKAQKNTITASIEDTRTPMSDYLEWIKATETLETALKAEKATVEAYLGKPKA